MDNHKPTILIVDDNAMNREMLIDILGEKYNFIQTSDGAEAVAVLNRHSESISLVLLDFVMPNMDGIAVLSVMKRNGWIRDIPVVMITAETAHDALSTAYDLGVTDFIRRPVDERIVCNRVSNTINLYAKQRRLSELAAEQIYSKAQNSATLVAVLSHIVEFRNGESGMHVLHINTITMLLLKELLKNGPAYGISHEDIPTICTASSLHDIGKIAIPENILNKPGKLTAEEFAVMKTHSAAGAQLLASVPYQKDMALMRFAHEIALGHHERWDGRGYPNGLKGAMIPITAQVVAIADVYDALTSTRVYKPAFSHEKALTMIRDGECGIFNPQLLKCLDAVADDLKSELDESSVERTLNRIFTGSTAEIMRNSDLSAQANVVRNLFKSESCHDFLFSKTNDFLFEFTLVPQVLTLSAAAAKHFSLPQTLVNPLQEPQFQKIATVAQLHALWKNAKNTSPDAPGFATTMTLNLNGTLSPYTVQMTALWSDGPKQQIIGLYGIIG